MDLRVNHDMNDTGHQRRLAQAVMRRQLKLSLRIAAVFMAMLLGLPLVNYFLPGLANLPLGGFTLTWFFLAILFYPITWFLSWLFIQRSNEIEADIARSMRHDVVGDTPGHAGESPAGDTYVPASTDADADTTPGNANTEGESR